MPPEFDGGYDFGRDRLEFIPFLAKLFPDSSLQRKSGLNEAPTILKRRKSTPWSVRLTDQIASRIITLGGIGTIIAVLLVVFVLISSVAPLFLSARMGKLERFPLPSEIGPVMKGGFDEQQMILWLLNERGQVWVLDASSGGLIDTIEPNIAIPADVRVVAASASEIQANGASGADTNQSVMIGLSDGTARLLTLQFSNMFAPASERSLEELRKENSKTIYRSISGGLIRSTQLTAVKHSEPWKVGDAPVNKLDFLAPTVGNSFSKETQFSWLASSGNELVFGQTKSKLNPLTKKLKTDTTVQRVDFTKHSEGNLVGMSLDPRASSALVATDQGEVFLIGLSGSKPPEWIESFDFKEPMKVVPTYATGLLGRETLLIGDDRGRVFGVFLTKTESGSEAEQTQHLSAVHQIDLGSNPIRKIATSPVARIVLSAPSNGPAQVAFVPTDEKMLELDFPATVIPGRDVGFSPKGNTIYAIGEKEIAFASFDQAYPEASFRSLFRPVWYEGYDAPRYLWQSTSGTASAEAKLSMIPLVFGTMKATFYTLLIGVPLALLAAIYSSEFMDRKWRARVKPAIEMMASIPSVVLGFIAAMVLAPMLREGIGWALTSMVVVPVCCLLTAYFWCLLPMNTMIRYQKWRIPILVLVLFLGIFLARPIAPWAERILFGSDFKSWLVASDGYEHGGWFLVLLPVVVFAMVLLFMVVLGPWTRSIALKLSPFQFAGFSIGRFAIAIGATLIATYLASLVAASSIGDIRGTVFGMYQERNALLVGGVLGFAIIPIIFTISDDALQAVPQHLRSASLGCGATPWQTTIRVVVPTAMSGLFSAIMIGFGRAVGETMVVLMAAGNTPVMDLNPFNGYKTLSATLATELPEAAIGSVHFRTLFLAAMILFALTLIANTAAEVVRSRFRKRAYQL